MNRYQKNLLEFEPEPDPPWLIALAGFLLALVVILGLFL